MRFLLRTGVPVVAALLCLPATAGATFGAPMSLPAVGGELPRAVAFGSDGRGAVVTQVGGPPHTRATLAVVTVPAAARTTFADTMLLDSVRRQDGGVDLLVRRGTDLTRSGDLILRRVLSSGRVLDLWSVRSTAYRGALARGRDRTVVTWPERSTLRFVTRPDGGVPTRPRSARLRLPGYSDVDVALDRRNRRIAAVTTPGGSLVLASVTARGTVVGRQVLRNTSGLIDIAVTPVGRIGVLVEDAGIEGEGGECVADRGGRHVRIVVRERDRSRFGPVQTIESPPFGCGSTRALLRATESDGLTVLYQAGSYDRPPLIVRAATAARGQPFGTPLTAASDARADTAVVTPTGELVIGLLRGADQPELFTGALSILRSRGVEQPLANASAFGPWLGVDRAGRAVLAWRTGDALHVAADQA